MNDYSKIKNLEKENKKSIAFDSGEIQKFISIVSHNNKNPFATLLGFLDLLSEDFDDLNDDERKYYLEEIKKSANLSYKFNERFFEWLYFQSGKVDFDFRPLNLFESIKSVLKSLPNGLRKKCKIINNIDEKFTCLLDEETFNKSINFIIENSIQYSQRGSEININLKINYDSYAIEVIDEGTGIYEGDLEKLFDCTKDPALYSSAIKEKGTGISLILAKLYIQANGGKINIKSTQSMGTTVCIEFPRSVLN